MKYPQLFKSIEESCFKTKSSVLWNDAKLWKEMIENAHI